ncbi:MAG: MFS transporter [Gammaproteobacteria bacterium]|nr:MFS transporter [Gammaproteobacteria bacterium]
MNTPAQRRTSPRLPAMLRALHHRNYRLFFIGQSVSLIGTWMTRLTTHWLMWRLTQSPEMLGLLGFISQAPTFLLAPLAGVWVDRLDRHRLLVLTQVLAMLQVFTLAALALFGHIQVWHVFALQLLHGVIVAFDIPTRQALLVDLVDDRADLPNAIALNSSMVNGSRLIGPSVAGVLIAWVGEGWCFFLDGLSYLAVIASLLAMRGLSHRRAPTAHKVLRELVDGLSYVRRFAPIRDILLLLALIGLVGMPYAVLLPVIATEVLGGGPHTLGFLMGAIGVGATCGALYLAARRSVLGLGRLIPLATGTFGLGLMALGLSRSFALSLGVMVLAGIGFMLHMASSNTLIQTLVRDDMRGRVMALYTVAFIGTAPFGSLIAGAVAARIGASATVTACGALCLLGAVAFGGGLPRLRAIVTPIYVERGILPAGDAACAVLGDKRP